jgi:exonuclease V gamma subunit
MKPPNTISMDFFVKPVKFFRKKRLAVRFPLIEPM